MKGTVTINQAGVDAAATIVDEINKEVIFKIYKPFPDCINQINNTQIDHAKEHDDMMPMYNLMEYS